MRFKGHTQEHRLLLIGLRWTEQLTIKQVPMKDYGQASLVKCFHNNRTNSFVIGKQVENSEQEKQDERQPE